MAQLEKDMDIHSTYYFRAKSHTFKPDIIKAIADLGHEIGYHYESLSDTNGDIPRALEDFEKNLKRFRKIVPVKTISMHGRPFKPFDNRDMWRNPKNHRLLLNKYNILGEVYLDIDYTDIAYINDTGRNWTSTKSNRRDRVDSDIKLDFENGDQLYDYLKSVPHPRMIFQVHPARWTDHIISYYLRFCFDTVANAGKQIISLACTITKPVRSRSR